MNRIPDRHQFTTTASKKPIEGKWTDRTALAGPTFKYASAVAQRYRIRYLSSISVEICSFNESCLYLLQIIGKNQCDDSFHLKFDRYAVIMKTLHAISECVFLSFNITVPTSQTVSSIR